MWEVHLSRHTVPYALLPSALGSVETRYRLRWAVWIRERVLGRMLIFHRAPAIYLRPSGTKQMQLFMSLCTRRVVAAHPQYIGDRLRRSRRNFVMSLCAEARAH